jgi:hypothetical protein
MWLCRELYRYLRDGGLPVPASFFANNDIMILESYALVNYAVRTAFRKRIAVFLSTTYCSVAYLDSNSVGVTSAVCIYKQ